MFVFFVLKQTGVCTLICLCNVLLKAVQICHVCVMFASWHWTFVVVDFPSLVSLSSPTVPAEAAFREDGDSESNFSSLKCELVESQPSMRQRYEGMYQCEFCPYFTHHLRHVTEHERTHTGEKPFRCSVCERPFAEISHLRVHMRTHTGEKPFSCEVCQKAFARKHDLTIHKRIHTGERPYQCRTCEKEFAQRHSCLRHERTHRVSSLTSVKRVGKRLAPKPI